MTITVSGTPEEIRCLMAQQNITVQQNTPRELPAWITLTQAMRLKWENWEAARARSWTDLRLQPNDGVAEDMLGDGSHAQKLFRRETVEKWLDEPLWEIQIREVSA